jgi:hypothetical protein
MIDYLAQEFDGQPVVGVEVGVHQGEGSLYILEHLNIQELHLIDPYAYDDPTRPDIAQERLQGARAEAESRIAAYTDKVKWWIMTSDEALPQLPPVHFAYIDGDHYYEPVKGDIHNCDKIVMPGGYIGGHDYTYGDMYVGGKLWKLNGEQIRIEVKLAVDEFVAEHGYYLFVAGDPVFPDWWVQKK